MLIEYISRADLLFSYLSNPVQKYHPSRVLTLVYQPFALGTISILAYREAKINTRKRNLFGYVLFFICSLMVLIVNPDSFFHFMFLSSKCTKFV